MAVRPEFRWWILTLVLVGVLVGISLLAMDRPNVVWRDGQPSCPHCRSAVNAFSSRCATCEEPFDWTVAPDDDSPLSPWSLSTLEAKALVDRVIALGEDVAAQRVATALGLEPDAAEAYLDAVGRGRCGYCGGTGIALDAKPSRRSDPCPVCLGQGACIACNGDRRMRVGDEAAFRALRQYVEALDDLDAALPPAVRREEARKLGDAFVRRYAGTVEATLILFEPGLQRSVPSQLDLQAASPATVLGVAQRGYSDDSAVGAARRRLDAVLEAVAGE